MAKIPKAISGQRKILLIRLVVNGLVQAIVSIIYAQLVKHLFDQLIDVSYSTTSSMLAGLGTGLGLSALIVIWLRMIERVDTERMGQSYARDVRIAMYDCLSSITYRDLQKRSQGGVVLRFVGDITALRQWVSLGLARLAIAMTTTLTALLALAWVNTMLAIALFLALSCSTLITLRLGQPLQDRAKQSRRRLSQLAGNINEKVSAMRVVQVCGQVSRERKRLIQQSVRLEEARVHWAQVVGQLRGSAQATTTLSIAVALFVGAIEVSAQRASAGTVVAAMSIVSFLSPSLRDLGRVQEYWYNSRVALSKLEEFLLIPALTQAVSAEETVDSNPSHLVFDQVKVDGSLYHISASIDQGQKVAIVGPNGAGKSTLLALAARLFDPDEGSIYLDGKNLVEYPLNSLRRSIGMVSPELPLLRGTIRRNLLYRWPKASPEEIEAVWELCGIDKIRSELPDGLNTRIAERGQGLSTGQRQRIALARALLGNPPLLLLDEADANLDIQSAKFLDKVLNSYSGTVIIVTHRPERLLTVDVIWYLDNGHLLSVTTPEDIKNTGGIVADFFRNLA